MLFCLILMFFFVYFSSFVFASGLFVKKNLVPSSGGNFFDGGPAKIFLRCAVSRLKNTHQCRSEVSRSDCDSRVVRRSEGSRSDPECNMLRLCSGV